jgi:hypothetical protein
MAISLDSEVRAAFFQRWMKVWKLKELLNKLDDEYELYPNRVGGLAVVEAGSGKFVGYVDFSAEELVMVESK